MYLAGKKLDLMLLGMTKNSFFKIKFRMLVWPIRRDDVAAGFEHGFKSKNRGLAKFKSRDHDDFPVLIPLPLPRAKLTSTLA